MGSGDQWGVRSRGGGQTEALLRIGDLLRVLCGIATAGLLITAFLGSAWCIACGAIASALLYLTEAADRAYRKSFNNEATGNVSRSFMPDLSPATRRRAARRKNRE